MTRDKGVALGGFMGAGKSTVGRRLAARLALPFVDTDQVLAERHGEISAQLAAGEPRFRARERAVIEELCADGTPRVLATGGGAWVDPANRARLREGHRLVVLRAELGTLRARVGEGMGRWLWDERVEARFQERRKAYEDADLVLDTDHRSIDVVVERIIAWLSEREAP